MFNAGFKKKTDKGFNSLNLEIFLKESKVVAATQEQDVTVRV